MILRGCHECREYGLPVGEPRDDWQDVYLERAARYAACVAAGHRVDWQYDVTMRMFGWLRPVEGTGEWIRRFRQASIWVAKKNKKSPTLAAWAHYLLSGDGEPGQCVFLAAKDGQQARKIAGEHAVQMLERSDELRAECRLNRSTLRIAHTPTASYMEPMSSGNSRTRESKEGLNGSILVDEIHVVDADFIQRLTRAGISRREPLHIEVSTAGKNADGYGRRRFDWARKVESGAVEDQELLVAIYAAPQDLSDEDLDADPLKYCRMANPALGHTVREEEILKDYATSKAKGLAELAEFKMYRLNIWQRGSNPWLAFDRWQLCKRDYAESDLAGRECAAGLDLSRTRDMSALVLCFPWPEDGDECVRLLSYFWLPHVRAKQLEWYHDLLLAARDGHLTLIEDRTTDYRQIRRKFKELAELFSIQKLVYDPHFAEETTKDMSEGIDGIESGTGVERLLFDQNDHNFAGPTLDWERLIEAGLLHHNGNPVLDRQIADVQVMRKINGVKRAVKEHKDSPKTIDGVIAGIMALAGAKLIVPATGGVEFW